MPKTLIILSIIAFGAAFALWDSIAPPAGLKSVRTQQALTPAPAMEFTDIKGQTYTLDQFRGKTIILNFWATWCSPCIIEFPQLLTLAKREADNIVFIAMSVDENPQDIDRFINKLPENIAQNIQLKNVIIGLDTDKRISKELFGTIMYPETYIIDKNGMIKQKIEGITDWLGHDIKAQL